MNLHETELFATVFNEVLALSESEVNSKVCCIIVVVVSFF